MNSICVYLGANPGKDEALLDAVANLGKLIANNGYRLIYGGSSMGLMGRLANAVLSCDGKVTGIIAQSLVKKERPLNTLDELITTDTIQERKQLLQQRADAFIVLPGGLGTFEEAFDTWCAIKIGAYKKPIGFLNVNGYYNKLFAFLSDCCDNGFITADQLSIPIISDNPQTLLNELFKVPTPQPIAVE